MEKFIIQKGNKKLSSVYLNELPESRTGKYNPYKMFVFRENSWYIFTKKELEEQMTYWDNSIFNDDRFSEDTKIKLRYFILNFHKNIRRAD